MPSSPLRQSLDCRWSSSPYTAGRGVAQKRNPKGEVGWMCPAGPTRGPWLSLCTSSSLLRLAGQRALPPARFTHGQPAATLSSSLGSICPGKPGSGPFSPLGTKDAPSHPGTIGGTKIPSTRALKTEGRTRAHCLLPGGGAHTGARQGRGAAATLNCLRRTHTEPRTQNTLRHT